ncbi:MAG: NAD(P)-binding domain-containing protein [Nanoarchaeota archaeon]
MVELAVIGGGTMGMYTARALSPHVDKVSIFDNHPLSMLDEPKNFQFDGIYNNALKSADFVLYCVPTDKVSEVMAQTLPFVKNGAIVGGQTSRKAPEKQAFDEFVQANPDRRLQYFSIHTMCNPQVANPATSRLALIRDGTSDGAFETAFGLYSNLPGIISEFESIKEHDRRVANTQVNTSRTMLSIASSFEEARCFPWLNGTYGSGIDAMKFALAMRAASFEPHVYKGIQFGNPEGREIVRHSMEVESELFGLIVGGRENLYVDRVLDAAEKIFKEKGNPILSAQTVDSFSKGRKMPNSHLSLVSYLVTEAEAGRDLFGDIKATTAMHTGLICLVDFLFNTTELGHAIRAPFYMPDVREDDLVFHNNFQAWSNAIVFESGELYDHRHSKMRAGLQNRLIKDEVERSKEVVKVCQDALEQRLAT